MNNVSPSTSISNQVIQTVADAKGSDPVELRPLADVIDTDALEAIFTPRSDTRKILQFEYEGYTVNVTHEGSVTLKSPCKAD